jgi:hypothetical protein
MNNDEVANGIPPIARLRVAAGGPHAQAPGRTALRNEMRGVETFCWSAAVSYQKGAGNKASRQRSRENIQFRTFSSSSGTRVRDLVVALRLTA